jgi:hypothetical protein
MFLDWDTMKSLRRSEEFDVQCYRHLPLLGEANDGLFLAKTTDDEPEPVLPAETLL